MIEKDKNNVFFNNCNSPTDANSNCFDCSSCAHNFFSLVVVVTDSVSFQVKQKLSLC